MGLCIPNIVDQNPYTELKLEKTVYQNLINQAYRLRLYHDSLSNCYSDLTGSIKMQLERVDIANVTPCIPDKKVIQLVTRGPIRLVICRGSYL